MKIADILKNKGDVVQTIEPTATIRQLLHLLAQYSIGAIVVSRDGRICHGIVSERDIVRRINDMGSSLLDLPVDTIMTKNVYTCEPDDNLVDLATVMTERRFRHVPVMVNGEMVGLVSIGDVVKHRIDQLMSERDHLEAYITA